MSYTHLSSRTVKIKKPHRCFCCNRQSMPPDKMIYTAGIYHGNFQSLYSCEICDDFMTPERWKDCDNEMGIGDIWEFEDYKQFREQHLKHTNEKDTNG